MHTPTTHPQSTHVHRPNVMFVWWDGCFSVEHGGQRRVFWCCPFITRKGLRFCGSVGMVGLGIEWERRCKEKSCQTVPYSVHTASLIESAFRQLMKISFWKCNANDVKRICTNGFFRRILCTLYFYVKSSIWKVMVMKILWQACNKGLKSKI